MFKKTTSNNNDELNSSSSRPKTRRGREDTFDKDNEQENTSNKDHRNSDIWRPSSEIDKTNPVDPLIGLDDVQNQTARSNEQINSDNTENQFKDWYPKDDDD